MVCSEAGSSFLTLIFQLANTILLVLLAYLGARFFVCSKKRREDREERLEKLEKRLDDMDKKRNYK